MTSDLFGEFDKGDFWREIPDPPVIAGKFFPPADCVLRVFRDNCRPEKIRVVIIGQDPYPEPGRAIGRCFAVNAGCDIPVSLQRIIRELFEQYGLKYNLKNSDPEFAFDYTLSHWAAQDVFLLNTALTVSPGLPGSHLPQWEKFTESVIKRLGRFGTGDSRRVFILWGNYAKNYSKYISKEHLILTCAHPASRTGGFSGNNHFVTANNFLVRNGISPIMWINTKQNDPIIKKIELPLPEIKPQSSSLSADDIKNKICASAKIAAEVKNLKTIRDEMRDVLLAVGEFEPLIEKFSEQIQNLDSTLSQIDVVLTTLNNEKINDRIKLMKDSIIVAAEDVDELTKNVCEIICDIKK